MMRVREITRWFEHRYGDSLPDDDAGRGDLDLFVNYLVQVNRHNPINAAVREARLWAPWLSHADARRMADRAIAHPIKFKADTIAEKLGATDAIRTAFRFTTIGACDLTHAERNKATRKRRTDTKREKRRAEGVMTRGQYEAQSLSRTKPTCQEAKENARLPRWFTPFRLFDA